jgi:hypothetical protein
MENKVVVGKSKILFWQLPGVTEKTTKHTDKAWSILWLTNCSPPEHMSITLSLKPTCLALNGQKRYVQ